MPIPSVTVNILNSQTVGQSLILKCSATTVRGITSRVDIMWSRDGLELNTIRGVNSSIIDDSESFTDTYTIQQLNTADENREYQCEVSINIDSPVKATGSVTLNVTGMFIILYTYLHILHTYITSPFPF